MTHLNACELSENVSVGPSKTQTLQSRSANSRAGLGCNTNRSNTFSTLADLPREAGTRTNSLGSSASHLSGLPRAKGALGRKAYLRSISALLSEKPCRRQPSCSRSSNAWRTHWKSQRRKATGGHDAALGGGRLAVVGCVSQVRPIDIRTKQFAADETTGKALDRRTVFGWDLSSRLLPLIHRSFRDGQVHRKGNL